MDDSQDAGLLPDPPVELGPRGLELWRSVLDSHELRPDEMRILEDACREVDLVELLEDALRGAPLTARGSQGQPVANPLVQEVRQHRSLVARLLGLLKLQAEGQEEQDALDRSQKARRAALTRHHGPQPPVLDDYRHAFRGAS